MIICDGKESEKNVYKSILIYIKSILIYKIKYTNINNI